MNNGRQVDVLIEDNTVGGNSFIVWADRGAKQIMANVPGVAMVNDYAYPNSYVVYYDPRHDVEWIKREVEAQLKINL